MVIFTSLSDTPAVSAQTTAYTTWPAGAIVAYDGVTAPDGWLLCDGQSISKSTYPNLYDVVGGTIPDLRSRFIVGVANGYSLNQAGGADSITLTTDQIPAHQHFGFGEAKSNWPLGVNGGNKNMGSNGGIDYDNYYYGTTNTGGGQSHENRPPFWALTYLIKY